MTAEAVFRPQKVANRQKAVLVAIARFWSLKHFAPTTAHIQQEAGIPSRPQLWGYLQKLKEAGLIKFEPSDARSVQPTELGWRESGVTAPCICMRG